MLTWEFDLDVAKEVWQEEAKLEGKQEAAMGMIKERVALDVISRCTSLPLFEI